MHLGIDASNIKLGGGLTHLVEVLSAANPYAHGFDTVSVFGSSALLKQLPVRPWLNRAGDPLLDSGYIKWWKWLKEKRLKVAPFLVDVLFTPGASPFPINSSIPVVSMSQNLLPFSRYEQQRFGLSKTHLRYEILRRIHSQSFSCAQGTIFLSEYARATITQQLKRQPKAFAVIPHGINSRFYRLPKLQMSLSCYSANKPFRILYVSTINFYKHQDIVSTAVAKLRQRGIPVTLTLVGAAHQPALIHLQKVLSTYDPTGEFIHYLGPLTFDSLHKVYHSHDAFVFASTCENMPNILLEAMASGLPIASSSTQPMPEVLSSAGVYFTPTDLQSVVDTLMSVVLDVDLRRRMSQAAYECSKHYSWDVAADRTLRFIMSVTKDGN